MGLMSGHEREWLRLMLENDEMVKSLGIDPDMDAKLKEQFIDIILNDPGFDINTFMEASSEPDFDTNCLESVKDDDESPCDWLVREAIEDLGNSIYDFEIGEEIYYSDLKVGERYLLTFPNDNTAVVELTNILRNQYTVDDYIFLNIDGAEMLANSAKSNSFIGNGEFPLPVSLMTTTRFNILKFG